MIGIRIQSAFGTVVAHFSIIFVSLSYAEGRTENMIVLDEMAVTNLGIETESVEPRSFESTVFAIGRLEETPSSHSVLSSRIAGRAVQVHAFVGDYVEEGMTLVEVESRQPGSPPPVIPLKAAQSGLVIESHVRLGQPVEPNLELMDIADRWLMWAVAKIPEGEAAKITPGTPARIRIPALGGEVALEAKLLRYGISADRQSATLDGIFELENSAGKLQPGMRVEFSIITSQREDVLSVPRAAVQGDPAKRLVFIKDFDVPNVYLRAPVRLGEQNDGYVEVLSGVFPGDEVVTQGAYSLAFAGGGTLSLKEALDAAHGHEHNEDGSEITEDQKAAKEASARASEVDSPSVRPYQIYSAVVTLLCLALIPVRARNRHSKD